MTSSVTGEQFIRTLRHYLEANQSRLIDTQPAPLKQVKEEPPKQATGFMKTMSSLWSTTTSAFVKEAPPPLQPPPPNAVIEAGALKDGSRPSSLYGIPIPYISLLAATSPDTNSLSNISYMPPRSCLTLDIHHLYFLLVQFEHLGLVEEIHLPVPPEHGLVETETTSTQGKAPSITSVGSVMSTLSLSTGWQFWSSKQDSNRPLHEDIVYIHQYLSNISALKLHMNLLTDTQDGVTKSGQRIIRGYESPLPQDGSVALPLSCFKKLRFLELNQISPNCIADWSQLKSSLTSMTIRGGHLENADTLFGQDMGWPELKMLSLQDNALITLDMESAQQLRSLTHLNLSSNLLIDIPVALASLYNLTSLNLSYNMISLTSSINTVLGNIQELDLRGNRLTVLAGLDRLWALERLDVRDNRISDAAEIGRLTALPNIRDIWIEGNPFTQSQPDYRVEIFNQFRKDDIDIELDGTKPNFAERRRISLPANHYSAKSPTQWPSAAVIETQAPVKTKKPARAKSKSNKRQIRLGRTIENENIPVPEACLSDDEESKKHRHRAVDLEESVQQEAKNSRKAASVRSRRSKKATAAEEKAAAQAANSEEFKKASEAFRKKIETMRKEAGTAQIIAYDTALWIFNLMIDIFFREVRPRGAHKIPKKGPVIFVVAPHANQFVDPIVLMRECGRRVSFLIAEKSMHQKGIGFFARMVSAIPVIRPQDLAKSGQGRIQLLNRKTDPLRIIGIDTQFTHQLKPRDSIVLPKGCGLSEVVEIISDTELIIKKEFKDLKALELLTRSEGTAYKCMPHVEQESVYKCVHDELNNGRCITIFPEGGSHDRAEMLPLKAGVTVMALGAMAKYKGLDVKIVPCGLNYFHAHRFRSRAVIEFGNPISISSELVEKFKAGGAEKREACSSLLDSIYNALKTVTLNAGSYETLMLIQAARRLYKPAHRKLHLSQVVDLNRRFLIGYNLFRDDPKVIELQQRVMAYNQLLKYHGIRDHQVSKLSNRNKGRLLWLLIKRIVVLIILALWAFPGSILNLPVIVLAKKLTHYKKKPPAALKSSTVKIAGRDVLATWKLLVGLVLLPTLYAFYSLIMFIVVLQTSLEVKYKLALPLMTWALLPFVSYASMRFGEIGFDILRSIQPTFLALLDPQAAETLRQNREKLSSNITELINEYGPKVFTDFDANYISKTIEPSPSRSTSTASLSWTSAPSKLPKVASGFFQQATRMNWLDDKNLFNWARSDEEDGFFDKFYFNISGRSRSGSVSESDSRNRSRSNSASHELLKIEGMTSLPSITQRHIPELIVTSTNDRKLSRRIFRIDDIDEKELEEDDDDSNNSKPGSESEDKKDK
ncbi:hypothetical protein A0J61_00763 [Choanephora cucurbitarum]|uniref:Phospholipid/glycerol acyltransferase domain-containing protein n=1 Tax=Choanephora cucurbitarum TaxID=101091 RepID=A0A1C7NQ10_9FUNG|nr:hypothetical protein A0J61_00763 [Choanephora cucurbitarum]